VNLEKLQSLGIFAENYSEQRVLFIAEVKSWWAGQEQITYYVGEYE
jgi:hypothetical protein